MIECVYSEDSTIARFEAKLAARVQNAATLHARPAYVLKRQRVAGWSPDREL